MKKPAVKEKTKETTKLGQTVLLTEADLGRMLHLSVRAIQAWRYEGRGPRFLKLSGRAVRYRLDHVESWLAEKVRRSTSDPGPHREDLDG